MGMKERAQLDRGIDRLDAIVETIRQGGRIPGAALAVVMDGAMVYAKGFGYRDLKRRKKMTADTLYPIASTSKALNTTLLGMLVDEGRLSWDAPVQHYLPRFRLRDPVASAHVTIRDLLTMRSGLPRHDWVWWGNKESRAEIVMRLAHLEPSAQFRQRFQYNNLTATVAGHVAEVITGSNWEDLVENRIFAPLGMPRTSCATPKDDNFTLSYHENTRRKLVPTKRRSAEVTGPSGGSVHSTVVDMTRWILFNLTGGGRKRGRLVSTETLAKIHSPQAVIGERPLARLPADATYALGWVVDWYNGHKRVSHAGYLHDVHSSVMFFPDRGIGMVSFTNFGCPLLAELINQQAFDTVMGLPTLQTIEQKLVIYEKAVTDTRQRNASVHRVPHTRPSHPLQDYSGKYHHAGYGEITIQKRGHKLHLRFRDLILLLRHWHYESWVAEDSELWTTHQAHPFDRANHLQFHADAKGEVMGLSLPLEPEVAPIRFERRR